MCVAVGAAVSDPVMANLRRGSRWKWANHAEGPNGLVQQPLREQRGSWPADWLGVGGEGGVKAERVCQWGGGRGGGWHKALVVGSVRLWRRLLASRP